MRRPRLSRPRPRAPRVTETAQRLLARATLRLPESALRRLAGPPRLTPEGWPMDLQTQALIRLMGLVGHPELHDASVDRSRRRMDQSTPIVDAPPARDVAAHNLELPGPGGPLFARIYRPFGLRAPAPAVLWLHGGGFVVGSIASHDRLCRALASRIPAAVIALHYRLAPEHPFPAAPQDAIAIFRHLVRNSAKLGLDARAIAVAGDSAGGTLAAVVAQATRDDEVRPAFQALVYPATDLTRSHPSHAMFREGPILSCTSMDWFLGHYLKAGDDPRDPLASPLWADDLSNLPPALVVTAGFDPLRDEGDAYARALEAAGNRVIHRCHQGMVHGFMQMSGVIDEARRALNLLAIDLRAALPAAAR